MSIFVRARFEVRDPQESEFVEIAASLRAAAAREPGTLSYRWFSAPDPGTYVALEQYVDSAAFMAHSEGSGELLGRLSATSEMTALELYGDVDEGLRTWAGTVPQAVVHPDAALGY